MEERIYGPLLRAKFHLDQCNVSPLWGEKPKNRPVSKNNTGRAALQADPAGKRVCRRIVENGYDGQVKTKLQI